MCLLIFILNIIRKGDAIIISQIINKYFFNVLIFGFNYISSIWQ